MFDCGLIFSTQEFLKLVPGLAIFPLTAYLALKKIGTGIAFSYTWSVDYIGGRFSSVTLVNTKDKATIIRGLTVNYEGVEFSLDEFEVPHILKPYEAIVIYPKTYSYLVVNSKEWDIPFKIDARFDLLVRLPDGLHRCRPLYEKRKFFVKRNKTLSIARKVTVKHNEQVYNPSRTAYILVYLYEGKLRTTVVESSGSIVDATGLGINFLNAYAMRSTGTVEAALKSSVPELSVAVYLPNQ